jgi:aminoglycoside phosphotransferase (APT) family kinase protein
MSAADTIEAQLRTFLANQSGEDAPVITNLRRIGVGRSRENWIFDLQRPDGAEPLILRRDPDGGLVDTDRVVEFGVLRALETSGIPSPTAHSIDAAGEWFGRPALIMRRADGVCDYRVLNGDRPLAERVALAVTFCDLLAQVHEVDWRAVGLADVLTDPGPEAARAELDRWDQIRQVDQREDLPELDLARELLRACAPRAERITLVHADFKPGNILLDGNRVTALLDWELAHLGDPYEDLGWVTQPLRAGEHLIEGHWGGGDLIGHYRELTGRAIDDAALRWWQAFSTFKTAVMQVSGLRAFLEGRSDEPFRPTRRVLATLLDQVRGGID